MVSYEGEEREDVIINIGFLICQVGRRFRCSRELRKYY